MSERLKVLVLSAEPPYPPTHGGARLKLFHILEYVSAHHDLTLLTMLETPEERDLLPPLQSYCQRLLAFDRRPMTATPTWRERFQAPFYKLAYTDEVANVIRCELRNHAYDLVHVDMAHMAVYTPLLHGRKKIIAAHDSQTVSYRSRLGLGRGIRQNLRARWLGHSVRNFEKNFYAKYDACVVVADEDRQMINQLCPRLPVHLIPNGIDLEYFRPTEQPTGNSHQLVFTGTMDFGPNVDAATWFVAEILPRIEAIQPNTHFMIVGRNPSEAVRRLSQHANVTVTGFVTDIRPYLTEAAVYVCPLRLGSGMKNKTLEAMAMGKAIVTTSEGASGIGGLSGQEYVITDHPDEFARAVAELCADPLQRQRLGQAARKLVEEHYSWENTGRLFHELYVFVGQTLHSGLTG